MKFIRKLHWQILVAMLVAIPFGLLAGAEGAQAIGWLGDIFLRLLKMVVVPLILVSIVNGVSGVGNLGGVGRISIKTVAYYLITSSAAILVGLVLANIIHPGDPTIMQTVSGQEVESDLTKSLDIAKQTTSLKDLLFRLIPENPIEDMVYSNEDPKRGPNILGIIFFAILFGACILALPEKRRTRVAKIFEDLFAVMMKMTGWIIMLAPFGVFALLAKVVGTTGFDAFSALGMYMLTVLSALLIHAFISLPLICFFIARRNPAAYARVMSPALATAFSSASSNATLPITMDQVEKGAGIPSRISSFVLPLGATVNMDGTALYECVAVLFIAQCYGISLDFVQQLMVMLTALLASIGAAGIPHAGLVMMGIVLSAVGLPLEGIGLILAVDRILDMCRTTVNVWSDSIGAASVARLED
jgi:Na+/H+-dicarboxylate symporter